MTLDFNDMSDGRYWESQEPLLLLVGNNVHEATYEWGRHQFYLYHNSHLNDRSEYEELPDYLDEDDDRIRGWAFARIPEDA